MKTLKFSIAVLMLVLTALQGFTQPTDNTFPEETLGWKIAIQASTYRRFTFIETLDKVRACGLRYVEAFPQQKIGGGMDGTTDFKMDAQTRQRIKDVLKSKDVQWISYGVVSPTNAEDWHRLFDFAQDMGIQTIVSEPKPEFLPLLNQLAMEYGIKVAVHNHASPTPYWNPETVLTAITDLDPAVGACADIGHWMRSGLRPIDCLRLLEGRLVSMHMKDLNAIGDLKAHDVWWGKGKANLKKVIKEMRKQTFQGVIAVEYEYRRDDPEFDSVPAIRESVAYLRSLL